MNHSITIGGLILAIGAFVGLLSAAGGLLSIFAGGMSDAPEEGNSIANTGCIFLIGGGLLCVGCLLKLVL